MRKIFLFIGTMFLACSIQAQDIFKQHGFNKEILTLSKGRYEEVFTSKEIVRVGSVLLNTKTNTIIEFLTEETEDTPFKAEHSSRWLTPDPLAEKYPSISPYVYCLNNPVNYIDPDGREVVFVIYQDDKQIHYTYRDGAFWDSNGNKYNPENQSSAYDTMNQTLAAFNAIEQSGDKDLIGQLNTLVNSDKKHFMSAGSSNYVEAFEPSVNTDKQKSMVENGTPVGSITRLNFSEKEQKDFREQEGVPNSNVTTVAHEMRHQFDFDQGNMKDRVKPSSAKSPQEIRAVRNENKIRAIIGLPSRTTYGGVKIKNL